MTRGDERRTGRRRIVVAGPHGADIVADDMALLRRFMAAGHSVLCLAPTISESDELTLAHAGADVEEIDLVADRFSFMPERQVTKRVAAILSQWRADTVIVHGDEVLAPVAIAAKRALVPRIVVVAGRTPASGEEDEGEGLSPKALELAKAFDAATSLLCINYDHAAQLEVGGLLPEQLSPVVLPWTGVDLNAFQQAPLPAMGDGLTILMIAELSRAHGVLDFCNAAQVIKQRGADVTFLLAGPASRGEGALSVGDIAPFKGAVEYLGEGAKRAELLQPCHVFAYPSRAETNPGPALEALAIGRPLIVADAPGCRELVDERVNGCLARPDDPQALAAAIESYLKRPELIPAMARASRQKAERRYDQRLVMAAMFDFLDLERAEVSAA